MSYKYEETSTRRKAGAKMDTRGAQKEDGNAMRQWTEDK